MGTYPDDSDQNVIECPNCGERVPMDVLACPHCGLVFYVDEISAPEAAEEHAPGWLGAALAGWAVSAVIAFLLNYLASRVWPDQPLPAGGQALVFLASPLGALAGGYLAARMSGKWSIWLPLSTAILSLFTAFLLVTRWYDPLSAGPRPLTTASWVLVVLAALFGAWLCRRLEEGIRLPLLSKPKERQLYNDLLAHVRHDVDTAERLVEYERRRNPLSNRATLIQNAIERLDRDRR
jgi:hypothetical protein